MANISSFGEFPLIDSIKKYANHRSGVIQGIGDDAAVVKSSKSSQLLVTTDMLIENVHFVKKLGGRLIGRKLIACNISDIAAMGGRPAYAVVSMGLPKRTQKTFVDDIYRGMSMLAKKYNISIIGGDTVCADVVTLSMTLFGSVGAKDFVRRSGAKIGHHIWVSGRLGNSLKSGHHARFMPRLDEAHYLIKKFKPSAMMDISDGLSSDIQHICQRSNVGAYLYVDRIPVNKGASISQALHDGEDFELLFTLSRTASKSLLKAKSKFKFQCIGEVVSKSKGIQLIDVKGKKPLKPKGFCHF